MTVLTTHSQENVPLVKWIDVLSRALRVW